MKRLLVRFVLMPALVLALLLPIWSAGAECPPGVNDPVLNLPWWEINPPRVYRTTRVVTRAAETAVETIPAEGNCYTAISRVNVRSQPSIHATRVQTIRSAGTEFVVTARVKNSSGELWYAVQLANATLGYIRSDLLNTDHVILLEDPYAYEEEQELKTVAASESGSAVLNIAKNAEEEKPESTPQVIYVTPAPESRPTPTPIIVYVTPEPEITPQVIYITQE